MIAAGVKYGKQMGWLKTGSSVVVVSGIAQGVSGSTNTMKVIDVTD